MKNVQVFHNFRLFDGVNPHLQPDAWLEAAGDRISRIGAGVHPKAEEAIDLGGRTVIPGLIDAHVHLMCPFAPHINVAVLCSLHRQIKLNLANCIRSGVTTVRDVGCSPGMIRRMKRWIKEGTAVGPRILCANSLIVPPGAMPEQIPTFPLPVRLCMGGQVVERVRAPDEIRGTVRRMAAQGADWIKTTHTDKSVWLNRPDPPVFEDACFEALVDEARKQALPVAMHQTWASGFRKAVALGVDSMEHAPLDTVTDEDIRRMVDAEIPIVPTLYVVTAGARSWLKTEGEKYLCEESLRQTRSLCQQLSAPEPPKKLWRLNEAMITRQTPVMIQNLRNMYAAGAAVGCGTDAGGAPFAVFGRIHEELRNLLKVVSSPFEALRSATAVNARILGLEDRLGVLEPGKLADFVVLEGNPLADITALRRPKMVVKDGRVAHQETM